MIDASEEDVIFKVQQALRMEELPKEAINLDELDPHIIDCKRQIAPVKELESFITHQIFPYPCRSKKNLSLVAKEKLKSLLCNNLDVFIWKHEDMVGINPRVSCHHLKIDLNASPYWQKNESP